MEDLAFGCDRVFIDKFKLKSEQNFIISLYCDEYFSFFNFSDIYYRIFNSNAIFTLIFVFILAPFINYSLFHLSTKFIAPTITSFHRRLKWNPVTTSFTLMAVTNGIPSIIIKLIQPIQLNVHQSLGSVYGAFIFNATIVSAVVIIASQKEVKMPKLAVIREMIYFLFSVLVVIIFGLIGEIGYSFIIIYFSLYFSYLILSIYLEEADKIDDVIEEFGFSFSPENQTFGLKKELKKKQSLNQRSLQFGEALKSTPVGLSTFEFEVNFDIKTKEDADNESNTNPPFFTFDNFKEIIFNHVIRSKLNLYTLFIEIPLNLVCLLIIPDTKNPLMKSVVRPVVLGMTLTVSFFTLQIIEFKIIYFLILFVLFSSLFILEKYMGLQLAQKENLQDIFSITSAVGLTKIYISLFCDVVKFFSFYYSLNELIVDAIFLSAADSLGKIYINIALCKQGEFVLAILSTYSVQTFQNFVGFSLILMSRINKHMFGFDVFNLHKPIEKLNGAAKISPALVFISTEIGLVVAIVSVILIYYHSNRFLIKKDFPKFLILIYISFSLYSIFIGHVK